MPQSTWLHNELQRLSTSTMGYEVYSGPGAIIKYVWPNGEPKFLSLVNNVVWSGEEFWLNQYPFLEQKINMDVGGNKVVYALDKSFPMTNKKLNKGSYAYTSHNNHYGHFIVDDLPRLALSRFYLNKPLLSIDQTRKSISDEVATLLNNTLESVSMVNIDPSTEFLCQSSLEVFDADSIFDIRFDNHYVSTYLTQKFIASSISSMKSIPSDPKLYFLPRMHPFETRISNYDKVSEVLSRLGFLTLDTNQMNLLSMAKVINDASIIVCESGSCTILASLASPPDCTVVSLQPCNLFDSPNKAMIHGGIPYILALMPKCQIFLGYPTNISTIQSSTKASYDADELSHKAIQLIADL